MEIADQLFRRESGRMVAVLTRIFGVENLALSEDVVQDAFCRALEIWSLRGLPDNPSAWLLATAKNRARDVLRREKTAQTFAPTLIRTIEERSSIVPAFDELFTPRLIKDDLLRMMFSCCHPRLREDVQVSLILHILCGFSVGEIAAALVSSHSAVEKRITRAKKILANSKHLFDVDLSAGFTERLVAVHKALYLLFNEGYHGASAETPVRAELCREAMRLAALLLDHPLGRSPATYALAALMALHAARLPGRVNSAGNLNPLIDQDRSQWDQQLIADGMHLLALSASGQVLTGYHVEAAIASIHTRAESVGSTDWQAILSLYDTLMKINPSPIVALNRLIAVAESQGPIRALEELKLVADLSRLVAYPFLEATRGELELRCGRPQIARAHFRAAIVLARNPMERRFLDQRIEACELQNIPILNKLLTSSKESTTGDLRTGGRGVDSSQD